MSKARSTRSTARWLQRRREEQLATEQRVREQVRARLRAIRMSPDDAEEQRRSFVYGNCRISNEHVTREMVDQVADELTAAQGHRQTEVSRPIDAGLDAAMPTTAGMESAMAGMESAVQQAMGHAMTAHRQAEFTRPIARPRAPIENLFGLGSLGSMVAGSLATFAMQQLLANNRRTPEVPTGADGSTITVSGMVVVVDDGQKSISQSPGAWLVNNEDSVIGRVATGRFAIVEGIAPHEELSYATLALLNDEGEVTARGRMLLKNLIAPEPLSPMIALARRRYVKNNPSEDARMFDFKIDGRSLYDFDQSELEELTVALDWHMGRQRPKPKAEP